jgi:hypothetical protein
MVIFIDFSVRYVNVYQERKGDFVRKKCWTKTPRLSRRVFNPQLMLMWTTRIRRCSTKFHRQVYELTTFLALKPDAQILVQPVILGPLAEPCLERLESRDLAWQFFRWILVAEIWARSWTEKGWHPMGNGPWQFLTTWKKHLEFFDMSQEWLKMT